MSAAHCWSLSLSVAVLLLGWSSVPQGCEPVFLSLQKSTNTHERQENMSVTGRSWFHNSPSPPPLTSSYEFPVRQAGLGRSRESGYRGRPGTLESRICRVVVIYRGY